jgi:hypothetical protein
MCLDCCFSDVALIVKQEQFKDTKEVIRSHKLKDRQYNDRRKGIKRRTMIYKTLHRKLEIELHKPH